MDNVVWHFMEERHLMTSSYWDDIASSVKAKTFGVLVELADEQIKHYKSDLFHDARWLDENITGFLQFEWVVRECGTHIGNDASVVRLEDGDKMYRFYIENRNNRWMLRIYQAGLAPNVPDTMPTDIDYSENEAYQLQAEKIESWVDTHERLTVDECDAAYTVAGCIFHPAPINREVENEPFIYPADTCSDINCDYDHCERGIANLAARTTSARLHSYTDDERREMFERTFPTHVNEIRNEPLAQTRKENALDEILRDLREKLEEANGVKETLEEYQSSISDSIDELEQYANEVEELIDSLDSLPSVSIYLDLDRVDFDS